MTEMIDPYVSLVSFQEALDAGGIKTEPGRVHSELMVHMDEPVGELRLTYALVETNVVKALVLFVQQQPIEGVACYGVGYATNECLRNQGLATSTLIKSIEELTNGLKAHIQQFYVEAIVGQSNFASQKVATRVLSTTPKPGIDQFSGQPIFAYVRMIETH